MSLPSVPQIAAMFALAQPFVPNKVDWPRWATPKLNGLRAMWVPGVGFVSRDGIPYNEGVLPHLEVALKDCKIWLDGELYCHGMSLQQINSRAGVVRSKPHEEHALIQFHVFDSPHIVGQFDDRQNQIKAHLPAPHVVQVPFKHCACKVKGNAAHDSFVSMGYEGTVYKSAGGYNPGRTNMMLKRKAWQDDDFQIVALVRGKVGKYDDTMGAVLCRTAKGHEFSVGSFEMNDDERHAIWTQRPAPTVAKVKYLGLTDKGVPYNSRVLTMI